MRFEWPFVLLGLLAVPALIAGYRWAGRRRRRQAVTFSSVALIRVARPASSAWRRHIPFALVMAAFAVLTLAGARPQVAVNVPSAGASVILALDVSGSMCATDVLPNRLSAAQAAVRKFVQAQESETQIGVVAFSGFAQLTVPPTTDHDELLDAIDSLTTGRGTTIGSAILKSVDAISQINPDVAPAGSDGTGIGGSTDSLPDPGATPTPDPGTPNAEKTYAPEIVVLLTDGANTRGVAPVEAAKVAAARGVRVYPIGFGTQNPTRMVCTAEQLGGSSFENFGRGGGGPGRGGPGLANALQADEPTLREVASTTGGQYFSASGADQLQKVLSELPRHVQLQHRQIELGAPLAGLAALLILLCVAAAVRWSTFPS
jgi:Ca-activated chloride channel family protein